MLMDGRTAERGRRNLVFRSFDDMIFETSTAFRQQPIRHHFAGPFDRQIGRKHPDIRRRPHRSMVFRQFGIKEVRPDRHIDAVPALRVKMHDRLGSNQRFEITPHGRRLIGQPVQPHCVLSIEERVRGAFD